MNIKVSLFLMASACAACAASADSGSSELDMSSSSGEGCFWGVVQSSAASVNGCSTDEALEQSAEAVCADKGTTVAAFAADEACGKGSSQQAKYECCPTTPPPPPCFTTKVGDAKLCRSDADLDELGVSACAAEGAKLVKIDPDEACPSVPPEGASYFATIACCY